MGEPCPRCGREDCASWLRIQSAPRKWRWVVYEKINLNDFAVEITQEEGGVHNLNIAEVKEVLRITLDKLAEKPLGAVIDLIATRGKESKKDAGQVETSE